MNKIFFTMIFTLIISLQNISYAANIESHAHSKYPEVIYPIVHTANASADKKINAKILAELDRFFNEAFSSSDPSKVTVNMNYEIGANQIKNNVVLSMILTESYYIKDAAYPVTEKRTLNFNTDSGEFIDWNYLTDVGDGSAKDILKNGIEKILRNYRTSDGIKVFDDNFQLQKLPENFYWDNNLELHIIFNPDEIAPRAVGFIEIKLG